MRQAVRSAESHGELESTARSCTFVAAFLRRADRGVARSALPSGKLAAANDRRNQGGLSLHVRPDAVKPLHQLGELQDVLRTAEAGRVVERELRVGGEVGQRRRVAAAEECVAVQAGEQLA